MADISPTRKTVSYILLCIGGAFCAAAYFIWPPRNYGYHHTTSADIQRMGVTAVLGIVGLLFLGFGCEPFMKRRDEQLESGEVPHDFWDNQN